MIIMSAMVGWLVLCQRLLIVVVVRGLLGAVAAKIFFGGTAPKFDATLPDVERESMYVGT